MSSLIDNSNLKQGPNPGSASIVPTEAKYPDAEPTENKYSLIPVETTPPVPAPPQGWRARITNLFYQKAAQLAGVIVETGQFWYDMATGTGQQIYSSGTTYVAKKAKEAKKAVVLSMKETVNHQPDPLLEQLSQELSGLQDPSTANAYTQEQRKDLAELLLFFAIQSNEVLAQTNEEDDSPAKLTGDQWDKIEALAENLKSEQPISAELLSEVLDVINHFRGLQMGLLQAGVEALKVHGTREIKTLLASTKPQTASKELLERSRLAERELQMRLLQPGGSRVVPENKIEEIKKKCTELGDLFTKISLIRLIFPEKFVLSIFPETLELAKEIKNTDAGLSEDQAFIKALRSKFNESKPSTFRTITFIFHMRVTAPILGFYIVHSVERIKEDLLNFLKKDPNRRLDDFFLLLVKPLLSHFSSFQSKLLEARGKVLDGTIEDLLQQYFAKMTIDGKTSALREMEFAQELTERYVPNFSLTDQLKGIIESFSLPNEIANLLLYVVKTVVWVVLYAVLRPLEIGLNFVAKRIIRFIVTKNLLPTLFETTKNALGIGASYQFLINKFIKEKLELLNLGLAAGASQLSAPLASSPVQQNQVANLVEQVLKTLPLQDAARGPLELNDYFAENISPEQFKKWIDGLVAAGISPVVALEILKYSESFLQQDILSEFAWYALDNLSYLLQTQFQEISQQDKAAIEDARTRELKKIIKYLIEEVVHSTLNPHKKINLDTALEIEMLKKATSEFVKLSASSNTNSFPKVEESWKKLNRMLTNLIDKFSNMKIPPLVELGASMGESFKEMTDEFKELLSELRGLLEKEKKYSELIQNLLNKNLYFQKEDLTHEQIFTALRALLDQIKEHRYDLWQLYQSTVRFRIRAKQIIEFPADQSERVLFDAFFRKFKDELIKAIEISTSKNEERQEVLNQKYDVIKGKLEVFMQWQQQLNPVEVPPQKELSLQILDSIRPELEPRLIDYSDKRVNRLITLFSKPYHWDGITWQIINAYMKARPQQ